jgi:hypothetical protein
MLIPHFPNWRTISDIKTIVYINPLGEQHSKIAKFIRGWRCLIYKRSMEGLDCGKGHGKWTLSTVLHTIQNDSVNCGIFVMKVSDFHLCDSPFRLPQLDTDNI